MHTYSKNGDGTFVVGYYMRDFNARDSLPVDTWCQLSTHDNERQAMQRVNALNGGDGLPYLYPCLYGLDIQRLDHE